jgi:hypothetical protein
MSPEAHAVLRSLREFHPWVGGSSPNGPWTFQAYVPDPCETSPHRVRNVRVEGRDIDKVVLEGARKVSEPNE